MKKTVLIVVTTFFFLGCAIYVPSPHSRTPLPSVEYGIEFNTYSSGWGWPFLRWPGIGWGHYGYGGYYGGYGYPYYGYGYGHDGYGYRHHRNRWTPGRYR
ncbi:MAG: hypothetical protein Q7J30_02040 [Candidatus Azambacteria bacterium]|nr:hypothetical protein [Candidatus Azambacteria bacterium]